MDLPVVAANLYLTGPVSGHVTEARLAECRKRPAPDGSFYASVYFQVQNTWYFLQLIALNPVPVSGNRSGYGGPGLYEALAEFRDMKLYPGGMINGDHAWGEPTTETLTVSPDEHSVTVGSATGNTPQSVYTKQLILWPERTDQTGPPPAPTPHPDQVVTIQGSWQCP